MPGGMRWNFTLNETQIACKPTTSTAGSSMPSTGSTDQMDSSSTGVYYTGYEDEGDMEMEDDEHRRLGEESNCMFVHHFNLSDVLVSSDANCPIIDAKFMEDDG